MGESTWMIVKKEKMSTKVINYFKNIFSKLLKNSNKKKKSKKDSKGDTLHTKNKLSKGTIAVHDVAVNELDPLIDLYRDSNKKLRNKINSIQ